MNPDQQQKLVSLSSNLQHELNVYAEEGIRLRKKVNLLCSALKEAGFLTNETGLEHAASSSAPEEENNLRRRKSSFKEEEKNENEPSKCVSNTKRGKVKKHSLDKKKFHIRESYLSTLLNISHFRALYNMLFAFVILFLISTFVHEIFDETQFLTDVNVVMCVFGDFKHLAIIWMIMQIASLLVPYCGLWLWKIVRSTEKKNSYLNSIFIGTYTIYQVSFCAYCTYYICRENFPLVASMFLLIEQFRFVMKTHSFVREKCEHIIQNPNEFISFSNLLYFQFAPTLVYRDRYPRTSHIRVCRVISNFLQVIVSWFVLYYIYKLSLNYVYTSLAKSKQHPLAKKILFSCYFILPGAATLFLTFFYLLHSWMNMWGEMLRFGDRLFYRDWWNSTSYGYFYRTWNVVVHDWLYSYIYRDVQIYMGHSKISRFVATINVFVISAIAHEYILAFTLRFFYPVLFIQFAGCGTIVHFIMGRNNSKGMNVFMWWANISGFGVQLALYTAEWYARRNPDCAPVFADGGKFVDFLVPRSLFCDSITEKLNVVKSPCYSAMG